MKIIDLLNKIANGEEVPKKIAIQNKVLIYNEDEILNLQDCYYMVDDEDATWEIWAYELNDKVEILEEEPRNINMCGSWLTKSEYDKFVKGEEEKKMPEKLEEFDIQGLEVSGYSMTQAEYLLEDGIRENRKMINWILDYLKSKGDE